MECGNIELNFNIQYGILLVGNTKAGKTTSCHYMKNQILEGVKIGQEVFYRLKDGKNIYKNHKIGEKRQS